MGWEVVRFIIIIERSAESWEVGEGRGVQLGGG